MNEYQFLNVYKAIVTNTATLDGVSNLYWDLRYTLKNDVLFKTQFSSLDPQYVDMITAIDIIARDIYQKGDGVLQRVCPGANIELFKQHTNKLIPVDKLSNIKGVDNTFFESVCSCDGMQFLEKAISTDQVGMTTKEEIASAIEEYERLYTAKIASPGEILTLYRYYGPGCPYEQDVIDRKLDMDGNEPMIVGGPASVSVIDKEGHLITANALRAAFTDFMKNFRTRNIQLYHCLKPGTKIMTSHGYKSIEDITIGTKVLTHTGMWRDVIKVIGHDLYDKIIKLTLSNGEIIEITAEHKVLTWKNEWVEAGNLSVNEVLVGNSYFALYNELLVTKIDPSDYTGYVYNLEVETDHSYCGKEIIYHNSDVQIGWPLPAYINKQGRVFKSGVNANELWLISEVRSDNPIAKKVMEEIKSGKIQGYSIAGSATDTEVLTKGSQVFIQVNALNLQEVTLCERGVNPGAFFEILKTDLSMNIDIPTSLTNVMQSLDLPEHTIFSAAGKILIKADRSNMITDEIIFKLREYIPAQIIIDVVKNIPNDAIPLFKTAIIPVGSVGGIKKDGIMMGGGYWDDFIATYPEYNTDEFSKFVVNTNKDHYGIDMLNEISLDEIRQLAEEYQKLECSITVKKQMMMPNYTDRGVLPVWSTRQVQIEKPLSEACPDLKNTGAALDIYDIVHYRPSENSLKECHLCKFWSTINDKIGYCSLIRLAVEPEFVCDKFISIPQAVEAERAAEVLGASFERKQMPINQLELFKEWVEKYLPEENITYDDFIKSYEDRLNKLVELQQDLGFPDPVPLSRAPSKQGLPEVKENPSFPWTVNEFGVTERESNQLKKKV